MKYAVGVDVGGTKTEFVLVNEKAKIIKEIKYKTTRNKKLFIKRITEGIGAVYDKDKNILGIGAGIPGYSKDGKVVKAPNLKIIEGINLKKIIKDKFRKKVVIENDASCMALAECKFGAGKNVRNVVCLTLGTGLGSGVIINKKLYNDSEIGHMTINEDGFKCSCGNIGCLEEYVSVRAIKRLSRKSFPGKSIVELEKLARKGNKKAIEIYEEVGYHLGTGLVNVINTLNPDVILIGGGLSKAGSLILNKARWEVKKRAYFKGTKIKLAKLKSSGAIGAGLLVFEDNYKV